MLEFIFRGQRHSQIWHKTCFYLLARMKFKSLFGRTYQFISFYVIFRIHAIFSQAQSWRILVIRFRNNNVPNFPRLLFMSPK